MSDRARALERYPIPIGLDRFMHWLDAYASWKGQFQRGFYWNGSITYEFLASDRKGVGYIHFDIKFDPDTIGLIYVSSRTSNDEAGQTNEPLKSEEAVIYFDTLIAEIRKEWPRKMKVMRCA